jgi:hypothetical protein
MEVDYLGFFTQISVEVIVELLDEQDCLPIPSYGVVLRKDCREAAFVIEGDPSYGRLLTREDASRALNIRVKLHEFGADLSPSAASNYRKDADRLKDLLGHTYYRDFLYLTGERRPLNSHQSEGRVQDGTEQALYRYGRSG